jgi:predicted adenine nucleotide alpha hydrolase (AANH) superfamily ATPase
MERDRSVIHAVHEQDLDEFLGKLRLLEDFKAGKIRCSSCNAIVTKDNLSIVYASDGAVKFLCSSSACSSKKNDPAVRDK